jgi:hypothetical protein
MTNLYTTKAIVCKMLERFPQARNNDNYLYLKVIQHLEKEYNVNLLKMPIDEFLLYGCDNVPVPPFESVRRTRQKLQREFPHLSSCEVVSELRAENEEAYREFARS